MKAISEVLSTGEAKHFRSFTGGFGGRTAAPASVPATTPAEPHGEPPAEPSAAPTTGPTGKGREEGRASRVSRGQPPAGKPGPLPGEYYQFSENHRKVLAFLLKNPTHITSKPLIARAVGASESSIKRALSKLQELGLISKPKYYANGLFQGFVYEIVDRERTRRTLAAQEGHRTDPPGESTANGNRNDRTPERPPIDDDLYSHENHHQKTDRELRDLYPALHEAGFWSAQYSMVAAAWAERGWNLDQLPEELEKAEYHLANGAAGIRENKCGYVMAALRKGRYSPPPGFRSSALIREEERAEEARRIRAVRLKALEDHFEAWWLALPLDRKKEIDSEVAATGNRGHLSFNNETFRRTNRLAWYRDNLFDPKEKGTSGEREKV